MAKKILIVDDDKGVLRLTEERLKAKGYQPITLDHPRFVEKTIKEHSPDMILLDIIMPYKDGYKVCQDIKKIFPKIPVVLFTSQPYEKELIDKAFKEFGADDYLLKPVTEEDLFAKIAKILKE